MSEKRSDDDLTGDHLRYLKLHAGRSILLRIRERYELSRLPIRMVKHPTDWGVRWLIVHRKLAEIEREIEAMR